MVVKEKYGSDAEEDDEEEQEDNDLLDRGS